MLVLAGKAAGGYSLLLMQSNMTHSIQNNSKKLCAENCEKGYLVSFPTRGKYMKPVYD